ncbi:MAG: hypothetical protein LBH05_08255, partial [Deferribacteraceae bacterium]|nr:hypothetical protein [Deferribacteraceae bacterium]
MSERSPELELLWNKAKTFGIADSIHPNTGIAKLQKATEEKEAEWNAINGITKPSPDSPESSQMTNSSQDNIKTPEEDKTSNLVISRDITPEQQKYFNNKEMARNIRCVVVCNNPAKSSLAGDLHAAGNSAAYIQKYIQYNVPTHIPLIIYNSLKEKKYMKVIKRKQQSPYGVIDMSQCIELPEFTIQDLPDLTFEEFNGIKQRQLA